MMIAFLQEVENVVVTVIHHWKHRGKQPQWWEMKFNGRIKDLSVKEIAAIIRNVYVF